MRIPPSPDPQARQSVPAFRDPLFAGMAPRGVLFLLAQNRRRLSELGAKYDELAADWFDHGRGEAETWRRAGELDRLHVEVVFTERLLKRLRSELKALAA